MSSVAEQVQNIKQNESSSQTQVLLLVFVEIAHQQRPDLVVAVTTDREERATNLKENVIVVVAVLQALAVLAQVEVRALTDQQHSK